MEFRKSIVVDKSIDQVWEVLGNQYAEAYRWASGLYHSKGKGAPVLQGATCDQRVCETDFGTVREKLRTLDAENYVLSYEVMEGFPFFVDTGVNNWKLTPEAGSTRVDIHLVITTKGFVGSVMSPMLKWQMNKVLDNVLSDFKYYIEVGNPSPRKLAEMAKSQKKAA